MNLNKPIVYLDNTDFDANGLLKYKKPVIVLLQGNFCGYCTKIKPMYQDFANKHSNKILVATIQADSSFQQDQALNKRINNIIPDIEGYPDFILFNDGKFISRFEENERTLQNLEKFISQIV